MHSNSDNIKFTTNRVVNDVIGKHFKSLRSKYQENLDSSMKGNDFTFD